MSYAALPVSAHALFLLAALLLFLGWAAAFVRSIQLRRPLVRLLICFILLGLNYLFLEGVLGANRSLYKELIFDKSALLQDIPVWLELLFAGLSTALLTAVMLDLRWTRRFRLTALSVNSAINDLPTGLCFYLPDGRVLLANDAVNRLSLSISGSTVLNGARFWQLIRNGAPKGRFEVVSRERDPILTLSDGRSYCFRRREKELWGKRVYELTALDVTEETALSRRLRENNRLLAERRDRLLGLSKLVEDEAAQKELLAAKVKIHDKLGECLLAAKRYLTLPEPSSRTALLESWEKGVEVLERGGDLRPQRETGYRAELRAAKDVGVRLELDGPLPEEEPALSVLRCAISECVTNTFRHAGGDCLTLRVEERMGDWLARFVNNGAAPAGEVRETGGLANLRKLCEDCGGTMRIESSPRFLLELTIPKEVEPHGL